MKQPNPGPRELRAARDEFRRLLQSKTLEAVWQRFFSANPFVFSSALPVRVAPQEIVPLGRPGRSEADFVFFPQQPRSYPSYGVIELKRPDSTILAVPRRDIVTLSRDAATALAQAQNYGRSLQRELVRSHGSHFFIGNPGQLFLIMGMSDEIASRVPGDIELAVLEGLLPKECRLIPFDTLLRMFEEAVPSQIVALVPASAETKPVSRPIGAQLAHQRPGDPLRHSIQLDVPPFVYPRPPELLLEVIEGTGLKTTDLDALWETPFFGAMEWLVKPQEECILRFRAAQAILETRIRALYESGQVRGASWG